MKNLIVLAVLLFASVAHAGDFRGRGSCNDFNRGFNQGFNEAQRQQRRGGRGTTIVAPGVRVFIR